MGISKQFVKNVIFFCGFGGILAGIWCLPRLAYAEVYKYVENGVVHYTNRPPEQTTYETIQKSLSSRSGRSKKVTQTSFSQKLPYINIIHEVADTYQLSAELLKAIIKIESNYNPRAVSPKGAQGLMQLMPATAKRFGVSDVFDPEENIIGGVKFLRYLFDEFGENNLKLVLAGYNAGEEAVRKYGNKIPPYAETRQYVKKVLALYLPTAKYKHTKSGTIYRYVGKNGVVTFTNIPRVN
jgi:soluble lytic murein transglycosylase-like protein